MEPSVFVIDDDASVRKSLERLLRSVGFSVKTFPSARAFLDAECADSPGCIVLDVQMPTMTGLELQNWLNAVGAYYPPVIFLTGYGSVPTSVLALKHGAENFLEKPVNADALLTAVNQAFARDTENREKQQELQTIRNNLNTLTVREQEVLRHVIVGRLNKQIAWELGISEKTVKIHRGRLMEKMNVRSVAELVSRMHKIGISGPESYSESYSNMSSDE